VCKLNGIHAVAARGCLSDWQPTSQGVVSHTNCLNMIISFPGTCSTRLSLALLDHITLSLWMKTCTYMVTVPLVVIDHTICA